MTAVICLGSVNAALAGPQAAGVDTDAVRRRTRPTGYASIAVPPDGAKTILLSLGANDVWADDAAAVADDVGGGADGSLFSTDLEVPPEVVRAGLEKARARGFVTVVDPAPTERLDDALLRLTDHLTPDHREAQELTGVDTSSVEGARRAAELLLERGVVHAHVKLRSGGCVSASAQGCTLHEAPDVDVVDATGAGDAFAAALAWALLDGRSTLDAVGLAVASSTIAVTGYGSQESYPDRDAVSAMAGRVRRRPLGV